MFYCFIITHFKGGLEKLNSWSRLRLYLHAQQCFIMINSLKTDEWMNERHPTREKLRRRETFRGSGLVECGEGDHQPTEDKLARSRGYRKGSARQQCSSSASFEATEAEQSLQRITMIATTQQNMTTDLVCVHFLLFCPHFFFFLFRFRARVCVWEKGVFCDVQWGIGVFAFSPVHTFLR